MSFNKEYWKNLAFVENSSPDILCPLCHRGKLNFITDKFVKEETKQSEIDRNDEDWEPFWLRYNFASIFKCDSPKCSHLVTCLGDGTVDHDVRYNEIADSWEEINTKIYTPRYFYPSLHIIDIGDGYPEKLAEQLISSFSHFFSDLTSCANKIRGCIEILMDLLKVKKTELKSNKRRNLSLHHRILLYKAQNSIVADYLLAIKWIGNSGSHQDEMTKEDILDAYQLLDYTLKKIYDNETGVINKLTREINKRKAPRSTKKIKPLF